MNLCHLGIIGEMAAIAGNAGPVGIDNHGIAGDISISIHNHDGGRPCDSSLSMSGLLSRSCQNAKMSSDGFKEKWSSSQWQASDYRAFPCDHSPVRSRTVTAPIIM
jgi:hypothetical protein